MTDSSQKRGANLTPARVLVVGDTQDLVNSIAPAVADLGHEVISAPDFGAALNVASEQHPDVVLVGASDLHASRLGFREQVREMVATSHSPVFVILPSPVDKEARNDALRAGASHVFEGPLDAEEVGLRLEITVSASRANDRAHAGALVDVETGLYNAAGLARRSREVTAEAMRAHTPVACVVFGASVDGERETHEASLRSAALLRTSGRLSDVIGRVGELEFVLLAPGTKERGALQLAVRLSAGLRLAVAQAMSPNTRGRLMSGYMAIQNLQYSPVESGELLARATNALRGRQAASFEWLPSFELTRGPVA